MVNIAECASTELMIASGFGGQGIMLLGKLLATAGMREGFEVTYLPSYGAEVRGGTAHCFISISQAPIASPVIEHPKSLLVMNQPSLVKFEQKLLSGGTLFANKKIEIGIAGSAAYPSTDLKVGYTQPEHISLSRYQQGENQRQNRLMLTDVEKRIAFLTLMKERLGSLTDDKERQLVSWQTQEKFLLGKYLEQEAKSAKIEEHGQDTQHNRKEAETIRVYQTVYPGVTIGIGASSFSIDTERSNVIFFRIGDRITIGP